MPSIALSNKLKRAQTQNQIGEPAVTINLLNISDRLSWVSRMSFNKRCVVYRASAEMLRLLKSYRYDLKDNLSYMTLTLSYVEFID